ncbi:MAG TPA: hypothetical protein VFL31_03330 [Nitrospiraceae bacterium]|nr:hypothetical protein [Nitrospiraceae bacterium]
MFERVGCQTAAVDTAGLFTGKQAGVLQHSKMLRDGGKRHVKGGSQLCHGRFAARQPLQYRTARRIGESRKGCVENA